MKSVDENLITEICGNVICFNPKLLAQLLGLPYDKTLTLPTESIEFYRNSALGKDSVSTSERDSLAHLPLLLRSLGHIINKMILPKSGSTNDLKKEGCYLLDCMVNDKSFNMTDLICQHMIYIRRKLTMHMPYGDLIFRLTTHNLDRASEKEKVTSVKLIGQKFI